VDGDDRRAGDGRRLLRRAPALRARATARNTVLLVVEQIDEASQRAYELAERIAPQGFRALHVPLRDTDPGIRPRWLHATGEKSRLETLDPEGGFVDAVLEQVWRQPRGESDFVTVVVPEEFERPSLAEQLRRRRELSLKLRLLAEPGVVVANVPVVRGECEKPPARLVVRVLVAGVDAASMRAVNYASTLQADDARAVNFAFSAEAATSMRRQWSREAPRLPLDVDEAPYRDLGQPLLRHLRALTADGDTTVLVLMPEVVVRGWRRLLHNQRALYLKRLLLFEPNVVLASVPYQLLR
jgi:hypothetical protein